jgi:acyl carrier protein
MLERMRVAGADPDARAVLPQQAREVDQNPPHVVMTPTRVSPGLVSATVMDQPLSMQVKEAIVRCLRLPLAPQDIADDVPLFGDGLGLDSIDALELVLELERMFGVKISDEQLGRLVLRSVNTIVGLIEQTQGQTPAASG